MHRVEDICLFVVVDDNLDVGMTIGALDRAIDVLTRRSPGLRTVVAQGSL